MLKDHARLMFIGFGPHSKSVYLPAIQKLSQRYPVSLNVVIEVKSEVESTKEYFKQKTNLEPLVVGVVPNPGAPKLSTETSLLLNRIARENKINGVVIACEPLSHMQYAVWAMKHGYHIMLDKPISTYEGISRKEDLGKQLYRDFETLIELQSYDKACVVHSQRRYHPGFQYVFDRIEEVAEKYGVPLTSMQAMECDGQWRCLTRSLRRTTIRTTQGMASYHTLAIIL